LATDPTKLLMDEQIKQYNSFLTLHYRKGGRRNKPTAFVHFQSEGFMDNTQSLIAMTIDDVIEELDTNSRFVQCLLKQMKTYDYTRQKIIALIFNKQVVLSDVLEIESSEYKSDSAD
jgi:hypothetical protein